jgi:superfamily II DNA helicase RecQ
MLLSATADNNLIKNIASFMGLGEFEVIGTTTSYTVPNVRITVIKKYFTEQRESLLNIIVQHCRKLIEEKKESSFKIHAITMSKTDAKDISDMLNYSGIDSMWLTSSLPPAKKSQLLQLWEEGNEKVLVSTFTDGIDNSETEDVIIVGGTYSIYSIVQALGRIRPQRQNICKASIHIFHSCRYTRYEERSVDDKVSRAIGANLFPSQSREHTKEYYQKMFHVDGYKKWIEQSVCYRKSLFEHFSIHSQSCNYCTNCIQKNTITKSSIQAKRLINNEENQKQLVCKAIKTMLHSCIVCSRVDCNGIQCFPTKPIRCFCCHVSISKATFHKRDQCPADTSGKKIETHGQSCPCCFMIFCKDIPERGKKEDHINNKCPHQKRIKRVLLYGVENAKDPGISARNLLVSALSNPTHWFNVMANNINCINRRKS